MARLFDSQLHPVNTAVPALVDAGAFERGLLGLTVADVDVERREFVLHKSLPVKSLTSTEVGHLQRRVGSPESSGEITAPIEMIQVDITDDGATEIGGADYARKTAWDTETIGNRVARQMHFTFGFEFHEGRGSDQLVSVKQADMCAATRGSFLDVVFFMVGKSGFVIDSCNAQFPGSNGLYFSHAEGAVNQGLVPFTVTAPVILPDADEPIARFLCRKALSQVVVFRDLCGGVPEDTVEFDGDFFGVADGIVAEVRSAKLSVAFGFRVDGSDVLEDLGFLHGGFAGVAPAGGDLTRAKVGSSDCGFFSAITKTIPVDHAVPFGRFVSAVKPDDSEAIECFSDKIGSASDLVFPFVVFLCAFDSTFMLKTTTGPGIPGSQRASRHNGGFPTVALTFPEPGFPAVTPNVFYGDQASESFICQVNGAFASAGGCITFSEGAGGGDTLATTIAPAKPLDTAAIGSAGLRNHGEFSESLPCEVNFCHCLQSLFVKIGNNSVADNLGHWNAKLFTRPLKAVKHLLREIEVRSFHVLNVSTQLAGVRA